MSRKVDLMFNVCVADDEFTNEFLLTAMYNLLITCGCNVDYGGAYEQYVSESGTKHSRCVAYIDCGKEDTPNVKKH
jgi:hypothetical protein